MSSDFNSNEVLVEQAWVVENLNLNIKPYKVSDVKAKYPHLRYIPFSSHLNAEVEILIGADVPKFFYILNMSKESLKMNRLL